MAGDNRGEMEKVLSHFKKDSDPLKYKAAKFLIENMPYRYSFEGSGMERYDSTYLAMSEVPQQKRDSVFCAIFGTIDFSDKKGIPVIQTMNASSLIKIIDKACETWRKISWQNEYSEELFLEYVLPFQIFNEQLSEWLETVDQEFPYLVSNIVRSKRGPTIQAEDNEGISSPIVMTESASGGKMRLLSDCSSKVSFKMSSPIPSRKFITLRYTSSDKDAQVRVTLNNKHIGNLKLEPTHTTKIFRNSRNSIEIEIPTGTSILNIEGLKGKVGLDYIMISSIEDVNNIPDVDFSKTYWRIKNKSNGQYLTFDTSEILKKTELLPAIKTKDNAKLRLDYQGYKCWSISETEDKANKLCLEAQYCSTDDNSFVGQYSFINGNHQKWIFIPLEDSCFRIMGKDSGLSLEAICDREGKEQII